MDMFGPFSCNKVSLTPIFCFVFWSKFKALQIHLIFALGMNVLFSCIQVIVNISNKKSLAVLNNFEVTLKDTFS